MSAIICSPAEYLLRRVANCPTCQRRRRFSGRYAVWYGATWSCCGCGDTWTDGERHRRPFRRGWRPKAISQAKSTWDQAGLQNRAAFDAWCHEQLGVTE
ncbi:hypothetical protein OHV05_24590 [Kitasatospora sp. NBC_00070]|uniref:hypothetical protein n=1 Tax=Kitasatospora sp. NBC_00070 TaxID=2975962 RepID=UPI003250498D